MSENFFDSYPEFIELDNRNDRPTSTVTAESLHNRFEVMLPRWLVEGKTVLDIGCCLGAAGHWALAHGASWYVGVEVQEGYALTADELLSRHWEDHQYAVVGQDAIKFLKYQGRSFDIVILAGVLHTMFDQFQALELAAAVTNEYLIIENAGVTELGPGMIQVWRQGNVNVHGKDLSTHSYTGGPASTAGLLAASIILETHGFSNEEGSLYPKPILGTIDPYRDVIPRLHRPLRYIARFKKQGYDSRTPTLNEQLVLDGSIPRGGDIAEKLGLHEQLKPVKTWEFDAEVAARFQEEAFNHIPDYERVIALCLHLAIRRSVHSQSLVVDIGSALGHTVDKFIRYGFTNTMGLESSLAMAEASLQREHIVLSSTFPTDLEADFVMANWTLHFIVERKAYIQDVFVGMKSGGTFILTDKNVQSPEMESLYIRFKLLNGVPEEYIFEKQEKLKGYLHPYPVEWYLDTLKEVGFKNVQIINSRYGFNTFYCEKP